MCFQHVRVDRKTKPLTTETPLSYELRVNVSTTGMQLPTTYPAFVKVGKQWVGLSIPNAIAMFLNLSYCSHKTAGPLNRGF
jgi:hypothetical protein